MRIAWATDIHLNFLDRAGLKRFGREVRMLDADLFIVSGDISEAPHLEAHLSALAEAAGQPALFVLGNHDYYRSDIEAVRQSVSRLHVSAGRWLPACEPIELPESLVVTGVDGWGDARFGDPVRSNVFLNDFIYIEDLAVEQELRLQRLRRLGELEAARAKELLAEAAVRGKHVIFVTHVPPFQEACWHEGRISDDNWLPFFACKAVGDELLAAAKRHPSVRFTVLCGHTHSEGRCQPLPNLVVMTGAAEYTDPRATLLKV